MPAKNSIGDRAPNFKHEDNRERPSCMRWRINIRTTNSLAVGGSVVTTMVPVHRILARRASSACTTIAFSPFAFFSLSVHASAYKSRAPSTINRRVASIRSRHCSTFCLLSPACRFYICGEPFRYTRMSASSLGQRLSTVIFVYPCERRRKTPRISRRDKRGRKKQSSNRGTPVSLQAWNADEGAKEIGTKEALPTR